MSLKLADNVEEVSKSSVPVDLALLSQVEELVELTKDVNLNLRSTITHTDRLIARQNLLIGICPVIIILLVTMLFFVYNFRRSQELVSSEMMMIHYHMTDIQTERKAISRDLEALNTSLGTLRVMIENSMCTESH